MNLCHEGIFDGAAQHWCFIALEERNSCRFLVSGPLVMV
jgi:hypothetical protein